MKIADRLLPDIIIRKRIFRSVAFTAMTAASVSCLVNVPRGVLVAIIMLLSAAVACLLYKYRADEKDMSKVIREIREISRYVDGINAPIRRGLPQGSTRIRGRVCRIIGRFRDKLRSVEDSLNMIKNGYFEFDNNTGALDRDQLIHMQRRVS